MVVLRDGCLARQSTVLRSSTMVLLVRALLQDPRVAATIAPLGPQTMLVMREGQSGWSGASHGRIIVRKSSTARFSRDHPTAWGEIREV